jgi:hypothetical protein
MKIGKTIPAVIAAAVFAFLSQVASADPVAQGSASAVDRQAAAAPQSSLTLIRARRGAGVRGTRARGVRGTAFRGGPRTVAARRGIGPRRTFVGGRRVVAGRRIAGTRRVRYWRNGRWWWGPAGGVGIVAGGGGSCYWNCRNAGHGPGFCRTYAANFC